MEQDQEFLTNHGQITMTLDGDANEVIIGDNRLSLKVASRGSCWDRGDTAGTILGIVRPSNSLSIVSSDFSAHCIRS